jgi:ribose transport system ATP-binding protein/rhamnose transport system ATP-binding protein
VLREGRTVAEAVAVGEMSGADLVRTMVGREVTDIYARKGAVGRSDANGQSVVLEVEHLAAQPLVRDISFRVHRGEILGLAGLVGAGRSDTVEAIFGLRQIDRGQVRLDGKPFRPRSPIDAIRAGIGFIPEDRRGKGLVPDLSVRENLLLASMGRRRGIGTGYGQSDAAARRLLEKLDLPPDRVLDNNILNLSGGMQQKIVLARWLLLEPQLLILDEPTRGVDIGTRSTIYGLLRGIAAAGTAVIVISSDFEEVLGLADRIVVVSDGVDVTDIPSAYLDVEKLTMFAAPRTSAEATHRTLEALVARFGGTAFWLHLEHARVYCFDSVAGRADADPGFAGGTFPMIEETAIPRALTESPGRFVVEPDGRLATVMFPVTTERGHDLGYIGLTLPGRQPPDAAPIGSLVQEMTGQAASHLI